MIHFYVNSVPDYLACGFGIVTVHCHVSCDCDCSVTSAAVTRRVPTISSVTSVRIQQARRPALTFIATADTRWRHHPTSPCEFLSCSRYLHCCYLHNCYLHVSASSALDKVLFYGFSVTYTFIQKCLHTVI